MNHFRFFITDVFTDTAFAGNPLAVFPQAQGLTTEQMALLAKEIGFSETTFVLPPENPACDYKLRIFTPDEELPMAGHPTIGTAHVLAEEGFLAPGSDRVVFEEGVGPVPVELSDNVWTMTQPSPKPGPIMERTDLLARLLGLDNADIRTDADAQMWGAGVLFLYVPLASRHALSRARIQPAVWEEARSQYPVPPLYLIYPEGSIVHARMFAPQFGITEDPATGSAAGPLCAYLGASGLMTPDGEGWIKVLVHQGDDMGRPSRIQTSCRYNGSTWEGALVGGKSVVQASGEWQV